MYSLYCTHVICAYCIHLKNNENKFDFIQSLLSPYTMYHFIMPFCYLNNRFKIQSSWSSSTLSHVVIVVVDHQVYIACWLLMCTVQSQSQLVKKEIQYTACVAVRQVSRYCTTTFMSMMTVKWRDMIAIPVVSLCMIIVAYSPPYSPL